MIIVEHMKHFVDNSWKPKFAWFDLDNSHYFHCLIEVATTKWHQIVQTRMKEIERMMMMVSLHPILTKMIHLDSHCLIRIHFRMTNRYYY